MESQFVPSASWEVWSFGLSMVLLGSCGDENDKTET